MGVHEWDVSIAEAASKNLLIVSCAIEPVYLSHD